VTRHSGFVLRHTAFV